MKKATCILLFISSVLYVHAQQIGCDGNRYFNAIFDNVTVSTNIKYGQNTTLGGITLDLLMDIYEPAGDLLEKRPVIVFAHGGGFISGSKVDMDYICKDFAQRGFVTASITYRLLDVPLIDPSVLQKEIVMAVSDMKAAIRFFREDAATANMYKIDADFIFAGGMSAGAIVANNLAYIDSLDTIAPALLDIINSNGGLEGNSSANTQYSSAVQGVLNYSGALGSVDFIDADDPPLYSFHNEFDNVVSCGVGSTGSGSCAMHVKANAVGIKNRFHFYSKSSGHVQWPYTYVEYESAQFLGEILCGEAPASLWEATSSGLESPGFVIFDMSAVDENVVWTISLPSRFDVGAQNFSRTTDGGQTWTTGTVPVSDSTFATVGIHALDENTAWIITISLPDQTSGKIYKTDDGGLNWSEQSSALTMPGEGPNAIWFFDKNDGFALAYIATGNIATDSHSGYITSDGGAHWERLTSDVYPVVPGERFSAYNLDLLEARGNHLWFGMRNGKVYHSADRGKTWEVNVIDPAQAIRSIAFKDEMHGIAISSYNTFFNISINRVYATSDGGTTWSELPAPPAPNLTGIQFVEGSAAAPGSCGSYVVYYGSNAPGGPGTAYTTDDGQTWTFISQQPFSSLDFVSPQVGWAGGITHGPESGLFKWTGPSLMGNSNCAASATENLTANTNLRIYPNPAADRVQIELTNDWLGDFTLQLVDVLGQSVFFESYSKNTPPWEGHLELSNLPPGIYKVMLSDGKKMLVGSVVRQ